VLRTERIAEHGNRSVAGLFLLCEHATEGGATSSVGKTLAVIRAACRRDGVVSAESSKSTVRSAPMAENAVVAEV
jgi:hypothetical protein